MINISKDSRINPLINRKCFEEDDKYGYFFDDEYEEDFVCVKAVKTNFFQ